jgi:hypothetical protein
MVGTQFSRQTVKGLQSRLHQAYQQDGYLKLAQHLFTKGEAMSATLLDTRCRVTQSFSALCISFLLLGGLAAGCGSPLKNETQFTVRSVKTLEPRLDFVPIEPTDWAIDSTDAWHIAQENGGNEFLRKNQTGAPDAFLSLERRNPPRSGSTLWYVAYTNHATGQHLYFLIDARTGVIVSNETE